MQLILSHLRRCIEDYDMIQPGDRIAVGVSGGKDSLVLLTAMARLQKFYPVPFELHALTVHPGVPEMDFGPVQTLCDELEVPYHIIPTQIFDIIFNVRKEKNPCSMCAKMRRGALHNAMAELGLNKIALGHHYDDAVETFFLSLFYEGRPRFAPCSTAGRGWCGEPPSGTTCPSSTTPVRRMEIPAARR